MNIVEKEAIDFNRDFYRNNYNLEALKSDLVSKLYDFNRDRDKLDFLKVIRIKTIDDKEKHSKTCKKGCFYEEIRDIGIFVIEQEIDDIKENYIFEPKDESKFSIDEETELHKRLNDIINKLEKLGQGQEIIFNEIDDLKMHFNLGKKTWFQLAIGKLVSLTLSKTIEETLVKEIFNSLSEGFENLPSLSNTLLNN